MLQRPGPTEVEHGQRGAGGEHPRWTAGRLRVSRLGFRATQRALPGTVAWARWSCTSTSVPWRAGHSVTLTLLSGSTHAARDNEAVDWGMGL